MKKLIVILAVIAMVGGFTASALAEVELYGSARMWTYWVNQDEEVTGTGHTDGDLLWTTGPFSRFGANFKSDKIRGTFELDYRDGAGFFGNFPDTDNETGSSYYQMRVRHLFGEWDFGSGKLLVGRTWPLTDWNVSMIQITGAGIQPFGGCGLNLARKSQVRLTFGDLKIAFLTPQGQASNAYAADGFGSMDTVFPQIEARYSMKLEMAELDFLGAYQYYKAENQATDVSDSVTSYVLGVRAKMNFGPLYVNLTGKYEVNAQNYGMVTAVDEMAIYENGSFKDNKAWGGAAVIGYKVNDMFTIEGTYGGIKSDADTTLTNEDEAFGYGVTAKITLAPGVYLFPEIVVLDYSDVTEDGVVTEQGKVTNYGMVWRIDFK